jgi:hypothetical protein
MKDKAVRMLSGGIGLVYLVLALAIGADPDVSSTFLFVMVGAGILCILAAIIFRGNALRTIFVVALVGTPVLLGIMAKVP